jgi:hypothetical protein
MNQGKKNDFQVSAVSNRTIIHSSDWGREYKEKAR